MPTPFTHRFRVRYAEVDPQSVVFNSRYLEYADILITEFWRERDVHFSGEDALEFHVVKATVDFVQPIRADEWVTGTAETRRIGTSSVTTDIVLLGESGEEDVRSRIELVHVHVDLETGKPLPIPEDVTARLMGG